MKTYKISCRKVKISISPGVEIFSFQPEGKGTCISKKKKKKKKNQPGLKFHSGMNFTSPTFNMPLSFEFFILKLQMRTDSNIPFDFLVDAKVVVRSRIN